MCIAIQEDSKREGKACTLRFFFEIRKSGEVKNLLEFPAKEVINLNAAVFNHFRCIHVFVLVTHNKCLMFTCSLYFEIVKKVFNFAFGILIEQKDHFWQKLS